MALTAPHQRWRLFGPEASGLEAAAEATHGPLAALVEMLNAAMRFEFDPHVALTLLTSAAACAAGAGARYAGDYGGAAEGVGLGPQQLLGGQGRHQVGS
jgi:hypothetical protein